MTITLSAFLDALADRLRKHAVWTDTISVSALREMILGARDDIAQHPTPALGWSKWLDWAGGPCPLPGGTPVQVQFRDDDEPFNNGLARIFAWDHTANTAAGIADIIRFRYRCDPSGWLELQPDKWTPPDVLWDEACPVRCEWTRFGPYGLSESTRPVSWEGITHIRLVAREKACEMPEGWRIVDGNLITPRGGHFVGIKSQVERHGPDNIRRAVDAWLSSMKERENAMNMAESK